MSGGASCHTRPAGHLQLCFDASVVLVRAAARLCKACGVTGMSKELPGCGGGAAYITCLKKVFRYMRVHAGVFWGTDA